MSSTLIKDGLVVDGTGSAPIQRDLAISDGKIVDMVGNPDHIIDAENRVVSPGFIDIHTHFDPQLCWDGLATPSLEHGVTTVVIGTAWSVRVSSIYILILIRNFVGTGLPRHRLNTG